MNDNDVDDMQGEFDYELLNTSILKMLKLNNEEKILDSTIETLSTMAPGSIIGISLLNPAERKMTLVRVKGIEGLKNKLNKILRFNIENHTITLTKEHYEKYKSKPENMVQIKGGLHEALLGSIPGNICRILEKLVQYEAYYAMPIISENEDIGAVSILTRNGKKIENLRIFETFIYQVSTLLAKNRMRNEESKLLDNFKFLNQTAGDILNIHTTKGIYEYLGEKLHELLPNAITIISKYDASKNVLKLKKAYGLDSAFIHEITNNLRLDFKNHHFYLAAEEKELFQSGNLEKTSHSFKEFLSRYFPKSVVLSIEKIYSAKNIYFIGLKKDGKLFAGVQFFMTHDKPLENKTLVEAFIRQVAAGLQRNLFEEALGKNEKELRVITETMSDLITSIDKDGSVIFKSGPWEKLLGQESLALMETSLFGIVHENDLPFLKTQVTGIAKDKQPFKTEVRLKTTGNQHKWFEIRGNILPDNLKDKDVVILALSDISIRKMVEDALIKNRRNLQEANITKDKLISIIAHDLKNPFNNIMGFSELLMRNSTSMNSEKIIQISSIIHNSSKTAFELLQNLLEWSRAKSDAINYNPVTFNISNVISDIYEFLSPRAMIKDIRLEINSEIDLHVKGDQNMISTVIRNLASNSIKFTSPGGTVTLRAEKINNKVKVCVEDNGIGIPPEISDQIFEINSDKIRTGTANEKGTGLGLIICRDFIEKNGSTLILDKNRKKGTRFCFILDFVKPEQSESNKSNE
ncbi:MAG: ATP-binding protein [bacterium]